MPEYLSPGVYVEEVERGAKPVEGVSTSTAGFLGRTERGPTDPRLVTSFADFQRLYGGFLDDSYLANAVDGFFRNGGNRCYVGRVTASTTVAEATMVAGGGSTSDETRPNELGASTPVLDFGEIDGASDDRSITVENLGAGDDADITIADDAGSITGDNADAFSFATETDGEITLSPGDTEKITVTFTPADDSDDEEDKQATLSIPHSGDDSPTTVELRGGIGAIGISTVGPGDWGEHVAVTVEDATMYKPGENQLFKLVVRYWADDDDLATVKTHHAKPDKVPEPDVEEVYDDLSPVQSSSNYYEKQVNSASSLIELERLAPGRPANSATAPTWLGGSFSAADLTLGDYQGDATEPPEERTGFAGFEKVDDISIVCVPDEHSIGGLTGAIVTHCENMGDRFAILQASQNPGTVGNLSPPVDSDYAAYYYPWLSVINPETSIAEEVPPGGHMAGIYARSDTEHGVHKAPANEVVRGVQELQRTITKGDQDVLNPRGVNCIRSFRGRGIRVWGARTTSSDPLWKYVNVRRLFLFVEESIDEGTQWVVFEPNDEQLWARVRQTIRNFLTNVWQDGALMGTTPDEAFFVKCDRSTMTQNDIDNGRLICEIGIAPVKPAEFVIFRIAQWTGNSEG